MTELSDKNKTLTQASRPPSWWLDRLAVLREHADGPAGRAPYDGAKSDLYTALLDIGKRMFVTSSFGWDLGSDHVEDLITGVVLGDGALSEPETADLDETQDPEEAPAISLGKRGLLDGWEWMQAPPTHPAAYAYTTMRNRLLSELRRAKTRREKSVSTAAPADVATRPAPEALPTGVASTLGDAARFYGFAMNAIAALPPQDALKTNPAFRAQDVQRVATLWSDLAGFVRRDVERHQHRLRWTAGVLPAHDNHARAWQATYYEFIGEDAYFDTTELYHMGGEAKTEAAQKHLTRFRDAYGEAANRCSAILDGTDGHPLRNRVDERGKLRLPREWAPVEHETLRSRVTQSKGEAK